MVTTGPFLIPVISIAILNSSKVFFNATAAFLVESSTIQYSFPGYFVNRS